MVKNTIDNVLNDKKYGHTYEVDFFNSKLYETNSVISNKDIKRVKNFFKVISVKHNEHGSSYSKYTNSCAILHFKQFTLEFFYNGYTDDWHDKDFLYEFITKNDTSYTIINKDLKKYLYSLFHKKRVVKLILNILIHITGIFNEHIGFTYYDR